MNPVTEACVLACVLDVLLCAGPCVLAVRGCVMREVGRSVGEKHAFWFFLQKKSWKLLLCGG